MKKLLTFIFAVCHSVLIGLLLCCSITYLLTSPLDHPRLFWFRMIVGFLATILIVGLLVVNIWYFSKLKNNNVYIFFEILTVLLLLLPFWNMWNLIFKQLQIMF